MKSFRKVTTILITALSIFVITSCNEEDSPENLELTEEQNLEISNDSLEKVFAESLSDIQRNLELIQEKEGIIIIGANSPGEEGIPLKEKILRNIQMINSLMEENRKKIKDLDKRLASYKSENSKLRKLTESSKERMKDYEMELESLKKELEDRNFEVTDLSVQMGEMQLITHMLEDMVSKGEKEINTAYYACGNYKELEKQGILTKTGGLLKMGRIKTLKNDFNENHFTEIDILKISSIPVYAKKAKLVTDHPANSYTFKEEGDQIASLEIKDPKTFWKVSKYMVLETK